MSKQIQGKDEMILTLLAKVDSLESTISDMNENVQVLLDQISTYQRKLFDTSSEKNHGYDEDGKEGSDKPDDKGGGNGGSNGGAVAGGSSKKKNCFVS